MAGGARLEGDPILCRHCYGAGLKSNGEYRDPRICGRCNGEGIERGGEIKTEPGRQRQAVPVFR